MHTPRHALSRREWMLVSCGLAAWIAIGSGGVWLFHQLTRGKQACGVPLEARTAQAQGTTPTQRNALQLLARTGRCE